MTPGRIFYAILLCTLSAPPHAGAQTRCVPIFGSLTSVPLTVQSIGWPDLAHASQLYGGADAVGSRRCLLADSIPPRDPGPDASGLRVVPLPIRAEAGYRSAYPFDRNNGAVWAGRGFTQSTSGGASLIRGPFRLTLYPTIAYQQNREFTTIESGLPGSVYRFPWQSIDWPQRFGSDGFWTADLGQSALTAVLGPALVSVGTENLWWGPAERYPILLSSTAPGFPHVRLGTAKPLGIGIARLEVGVVWGRLGESSYYNVDPTDDRRLLTLVSLGVRPYFAPGLALGASLLQHHVWEDPAAAALDLVIGPGSNTPSNAIASLVADWRFHEAAARIYAEWAREDYFLNLEDLVTEIDHSQGYVLGLEKVLRATSGEWRVRWELTRLSRANTQSYRDPRPTFYEHVRVVQGHTHAGQMLGAAIGPGSNAQFLAADLKTEDRMFGAYLERIRHDDDAYEDRFARTYGFRGHDIEVTLGAYGIEGAGRITLQWDLGLSRRKNRDFIGLDGVSWDFKRETNLAASLTAWWLPGS